MLRKAVTRFVSGCWLISIAVAGLAATREPNDVLLRVVDVGAGECCVVQMPGDRYMVYDTGERNGQQHECAMRGIKKLIPKGSAIELLVLSHTDSDHVGSVPYLCSNYKVRRVIRSGMERGPVWENAVTAIRQETKSDGCRDINLAEADFPPGATYRFGDVFMTMVCGFSSPPDEWKLISTSEKNNAGSIVIRIEYHGRSVLLGGDTVGRHLKGPDAQCIAAEKYMIDMSPVVRLQSDVLVAPHHGGNNAGSTDFIGAVNPAYVIFSAGHKHGHPTAAAARRYLANGIAAENIFRTDRGDKEDDPDHWQEGGIGKDPPGDDDVDVLIKDNGEVSVGYVNEDGKPLPDTGDDPTEDE